MRGQTTNDRPAPLIEPSPPMLASPHPAGWPLPVWCNEAEPSARDAAARALACPSVHGRDRSLPLWGRLQRFRSFITLNTIPFTRTTQLAWRFPDETRMVKRFQRLIQNNPAVNDSTPANPNPCLPLKSACATPDFWFAPCSS